MLTAGDMKVRRVDRIDLQGTSLVLESVREADGGEYSCEIEADQEYPVAIKHQLEVLSKSQKKPIEKSIFL